MITTSKKISTSIISGCSCVHHFHSSNLEQSYREKKYYRRIDIVISNKYCLRASLAIMEAGKVDEKRERKAKRRRSYYVSSVLCLCSLLLFVLRTLERIMSALCVVFVLFVDGGR